MLCDRDVTSDILCIVICRVSDQKALTKLIMWTSRKLLADVQRPIRMKGTSGNLICSLMYLLYSLLLGIDIYD